MARSLDHTIAMMGVLSRRAKKKRIQELLRWSAGEIKLRREKRLLKCKGQISRNIASIVTRVSDSFWLCLLEGGSLGEVGWL